jgi:hypothetical protein
LPEAGRKMVAMRLGERVNILTETGRCEGGQPHVRRRIGAAPCIQIGSFNCPVEYEEEMHAGYVRPRACRRTARPPPASASASSTRSPGGPST